MREQFHAKEINLVYVSAHENAADIFTKTLSREKFEYFCKELGIFHGQHSSNTWIVTTFKFTPFISGGFVILDVYPMKDLV